jgi:hypothetical protein
LQQNNWLTHLSLRLWIGKFCIEPIVEPCILRICWSISNFSCLNASTSCKEQKYKIVIQNCFL